MPTESREDQLLEACGEGSRSACLELGEIYVNRETPRLIRTHITRVILFIALVNILPIIIGLTIYLVYDAIVPHSIGFLILGVGLIFFVVSVMLLGYIVSISRRRATVVTTILIVLWIFIPLIMLYAIMLMGPYHF